MRVLIIILTLFVSSPLSAKAYYGDTKPYRGGGLGCLTSETRSLMQSIMRIFGGVQIISTCRAGAVIAKSGKPSYHRYGKAVDFKVSGHSKSKVIAWLRKNHKGGTMTYYDMNHIHVDTGPKFVALNRSSKGGGKYAKRKQRRYS